jgi:Zn-dependent metalloprotease
MNNGKNILGLMIILLFTFFTINSIFAGGNPSASNNDSLENIRKAKSIITGRFGLKFELDENGIPTRIEEDLSKGITAVDPIEKGYQFFEINKDLFKINNPRKELIVEKASTSYIRFSWAPNGVKVGCPGYKIFFNKDGKPNLIKGEIYIEARNIDTHPKINAEQAKQISLNDSKAYHTTIENVKGVELLIGKFDDVLRLAWAVNVCKLDSVIFNSDYYIDAQTGEILDIKTRIRD